MNPETEPLRKLDQLVDLRLWICYFKYETINQTKIKKNIYYWKLMGFKMLFKMYTVQIYLVH